MTDEEGKTQMAAAGFLDYSGQVNLQRLLQCVAGHVLPPSQPMGCLQFPETFGAIELYYLGAG